MGAWQLVSGVPGMYTKSRESKPPSPGVSHPGVDKYDDASRKFIDLGHQICKDRKILIHT